MDIAAVPRRAGTDKLQAHELCSSLNSRLESNKEEEEDENGLDTGAESRFVFQFA
jgi:hypothetical protein